MFINQSACSFPFKLQQPELRVNPYLFKALQEIKMLNKSTAALCSFPVARTLGTSTSSIPVPWAPAGGWQHWGDTPKDTLLTCAYIFALVRG